MAWIASVTVTGHLTVPAALFGADGRKDALRELTVSVLAATFVCGLNDFFRTGVFLVF